MAEFTEPLFWSDCLVKEMRVEEAIRIIKQTTVITLRDRLLLELLQHQLDYPCPVLRRALQQLNAMSGHKPYCKPPTQSDATPDILSNLIFKKVITNPLDREKKEQIEISMTKLRDWIKSNFLSQCRYKYSWFALWCFFIENKILEETKVSSFCEQMRQWFPDAPLKPEESEVNRYREPYLGTAPYRVWQESVFINKRKKPKQSVKGYRHLERICFILADAFLVKRLGEIIEQQ